MLPTRFDEGGNDERILSDDVRRKRRPLCAFCSSYINRAEIAGICRRRRKGLGVPGPQRVADRKWYDFETFWSCSPRLAALDQRTQQWPANDLALIHAVAAYLQAYQITHEKPYLTRGEALLDYLFLYQQAWTNPALRT